MYTVPLCWTHTVREIIKMNDSVRSAGPSWQPVYLGDSKYLCPTDCLSYGCVSISVHLETVSRPPQKMTTFILHPGCLNKPEEKFELSLGCVEQAGWSTNARFWGREVAFSQRPLGLLICWELYSSSDTRTLLTHFWRVLLRKTGRGEMDGFPFWGTTSPLFFLVMLNTSELQG